MEEKMVALSVLAVFVSGGVVFFWNTIIHPRCHKCGKRGWILDTVMAQKDGLIYHTVCVPPKTQ